MGRGTSYRDNCRDNCQNNSQNKFQRRHVFRNRLHIIYLLISHNTLVSKLLPNFQQECRTARVVVQWIHCTTVRVVHVQSLLVPRTIPGTKFSTRLHVQCTVNSLTTARAVYMPMSPVWYFDFSYMPMSPVWYFDFSFRFETDQIPQEVIWTRTIGTCTKIRRIKSWWGKTT